MPLALNDVIQISLAATLYESRILMILHYYVYTAPAGSTPEANLIDAAAKFNPGGVSPATISQKLKLAQCPELVYEYTRAQRVYPTRTTYQEIAAGAGVTGTFAGVSAPSNFAVSIEKITPATGRMGIGRIQMAGADKGSISAAKWTQAFLDAEVTDVANAMLDEVTVPTENYKLRPCIYNPNGAGVHFNALSAFRVQQSVRTMHRRTLRVGE